MRKPLMIALTASMLAAAVPVAANAAVTEGSAQIVSSVSFRTAPSTSSEVMRYLKKGEKVSVLEETNRYWLKVRDASGQTGYISSSSSYVNMISAPAEEAASAANAVIVSSVSFRAAPSASGERIRYLQKDEQVTVTSKVNDYWYAVTDSKGQSGYVSTSSQYIRLTGTIAAPTTGGSGSGSNSGSGSSADAGTGGASGSSGSSGQTQAPVSATNAVIVSSVSFRAAPSTSGERIRYLQKDEQVTVTSKVNDYWYAVTDSKGQSGFVSTSSQYIKLTGAIATPTAGGSGSNSGPGSSADAGTGGASGSGAAEQPSASAQAEAVIAAGMKYLGTPYEYGSDRDTTTTFDCSDFVRQAFKDALGITLPADSAAQGEYVRGKSAVTTDWTQLKRGDLMFFMDYLGTSASLYQNKSPFTTPVTHVGIYLGDGQVLHTYSNESGGVRIDSIQGRHWEYRFLYGGSAL